MHIDEVLAQVTSQQNDLIVSKDWTQGRTLFGGISSALLYQHIRRVVAQDKVLRSLNINFVGPLMAEQAFHVEVELLREGKNATQMAARAIQQGQTMVMATAVFAISRQSKISVENQRTHGMEPAKKAKFIPQIPKVTPKFFRHFDIDMREGSVPFTGSKIAHQTGWMRFKKAPQTIHDAHIIAMADAWPPAPLQMLKWPAPASSMSWNLEFVHPHRPIAPTSWIGFADHTVQAGDGYAHTEAHLWDPEGELIALSRQVVGIFD